MGQGTRIIDVAGLDALVTELRSRGYSVVGPTVRDGAIINAPITSTADLPHGVGDEQNSSHYRLTERDDGAFFGFAAGAQSMKPILFPANELLFKGTRDDGAVEIDAATAKQIQAVGPPYALIGMRGCDISAMLIQDTVLTKRAVADSNYQARRAEAFIVGATCGTPAGTCFCASMGSGPRAKEGFDLNLTEVIDGDAHTFVVDVGSDRGADVLDAVSAAVATAAQSRAADAVSANAAKHMGRELETDGLKELLYDSAESSRWEEIASRCLACTNCTLVCPTCFCTSVEDITDLSGDKTERHRVWDSCFSEDFSYIHGGSVRPSVQSRYRQWMTHKLAAWEDQFGISGCVGCGRCITWCPAAIDITAEAAAMRSATPDTVPAAQGSK